MREDAHSTGRNTFGYYPFFQNVCDAADAASVFWQPILKAVGRTQLEFAGLQARQAQAVLHWAHQLMQPQSPMDLANANAQLWSAMFEQYMSSLPRVVAAVSTASGTPAVLPLPAKRPHDTLILLDREEEVTGAPERRVA